MAVRLAWVAVFLPLLFWGQAAQAEGATDGGWNVLFDGSDLDAWRTYGEDAVRPQWQIDNGLLVLQERRGGDLITREQYDNFELELEWWVSSGGNSGIFFLADESGKPIYIRAPEVQILDNERHRDRRQADRRSGSLYDLIAAPPEAQKPAEQWNSVVIRHDRGALQVRQNGILCADIQIGGDAWNALVHDSKFRNWTGFGENGSGHIGLQDHGDRVAFRNIRVKRLP